MTSYHEEFNLPIVFKTETYKQLLGEVISENNLKQLRIAETEKYAHVTFFFNGGSDTPSPGEDRILIPSPKVASYDLKPEMSAHEVTDALIKAIDKNIYDFIVLNFANPDMVGHTGKLPAAIKALEAVDECMDKVLNKLLEKNADVFITSDHGNCEQMYETGTKEPHTAHTTNKVFLIAFGERFKNLKLKSGKLSDIAPTLLKLMKINIPDEMTGSLLID
jgi:2,3-bisphosphoglycerate-independent phosphoglycerate mutase